MSERASPVGRPRALGALWAGAILTALGGCMALIDAPGDPSTTCTFKGSASDECAKCIAGACQPQVNTCCGDGSCQNELAALDDCATGNKTSCATIGAGAASTTPAGGLAACLNAHCALACGPAGDPNSVVDAGGDGDATVQKRAACTSSKDLESCACEVVVDVGTDAGPPPHCGAPALSANEIRCCVKKSWPALGATCRCDKVRCSSRTDSCSCEINPEINDDQSTCSAPSFDWTCCLSTERDYCYCAQGFSCQAGSEIAPGSTCNPSDLPCAEDEDPVSSCQ